MQRLELELSNRTGFTLVLSVLLIMVFLGTAVMAVDVGHMRVYRAEVHSAADAAALAGIEKYALTSDTTSARAEAKLYAGKFTADTSTLVLADSDFKFGHWNRTTSTFSSAVGDTGLPAARAIVRFVGKYTFAPALNGHISQHNVSATSIAVGSFTKSVTKSTCVAPVVLPMAALFQQLGEPGKGNTDTLTASEISQLSGSPAKTDTLQLQNGSQVGQLDGVFYQAQLPPVLTAGGATPTGQANSASWFRSAFTCSDGVDPAVGVGDWLGTVPGVKAKKTQDGVDNVATTGGITHYPVTLEVVLTDRIGTPQPGLGCPCLHVAYVGAFTFTEAPGNKSVTGYFTALSPLAGGIVSSDSGTSPLTLISKIRLVF